MSRIDEKSQIQLIKDFKQFYSNILLYLNKHFNFSDNILKQVSVLNFKEKIDYNNLLILIDSYNLNLNKDAIFDEITIINQKIESINPSHSVEERIKEIFTDNQIYPNFHSILSYFYSIPISNAHVERAFSLLKKNLTDERNKLSIKSIEAEILIKNNFEMECKDLLKKLRE